MYVDVIVFLVLLILVLIFYKRRRFQSVIFYVSIFDIILRLLAFIRTNIPLKDISKLIGKYLPNSIFDMITKYTNNPIAQILGWIFVAVEICFLYFVIKILIKKKKI